MANCIHVNLFKVKGPQRSQVMVCKKTKKPTEFLTVTHSLMLFHETL